jgi:hypothetical protein
MRAAVAGLFLLAGCGGGGGTGGEVDAGRDGSALDAARADTGGGADAAGMCAHTGPPIIDPSTFPPCPMCMGGHCVPAALVPMAERERLADCDAETKCVPDIFIETGGDFLLPTCRSVGDAEGRCVSVCVPEVGAQAGFLPQGSCDATERCAPCYDPTDGTDTGVCSLSCDTGPTEPPVMFTMCCGGRGSCVPATAVPEEQRSQLGEDTCPAGMGFLCAPSAFTDPMFRPMTCRSAGGGEGRCLPDCLPALAEQRDFLPRSTGGEGELCAPCYDPRTGEDSGACRQNGDMPAEPPFTFPACCEDRGTCVPMELVPEDRRMSLSMESCPGGMGYLCVPDVFLDDPMHRFESCTTDGIIGGGEPGACVLSCLLGFRAFLLSQSTCQDYERCAPCIDPISGMPSGACE